MIISRNIRFFRIVCLSQPYVVLEVILKVYVMTVNFEEAKRMFT